MLLFIRMIPKSVTRDELLRFVYKGMNSSWMRFIERQGSIVSIWIKRFTSQETHTVEYHGIANIEPATSAQAAIRRLNRANLKGRSVEVREFFHRSPLRDRRKGHSSIEHGSPNDHRSRDRRRYLFGNEQVSVSGSVNAGYASSVRPQINWSLETLFFRR